jgi:hypothetical protein
MDTDKKVNKEATIKAIVDKCNSDITMSIKTDEFNKKVLEQGEEFIITAAGFCGVDVIFEE